MQAARGASLNTSDGTDPATHTRPRRRQLLLFAGIAVTGFLVDLVSKTLAVENLAGEPKVEILGQWFSLYLTYNSGAAFSFLTGQTEILAVIALSAAVAVVWVAARRLASTGWAVALGFLLGGITGNLSDRIFRDPGPMRGHVVDFFMFPNFPVFNVADICINIAAALIIIQALRGVRVDGLLHQDQPEGKATES